jgi:AraC-like DNA-binding protein
MSRGNLHRKLKQLTNYGPNEYIRMIKLKNAAELLKSGEYNIEEIVFKLGFNSSSYFIKCFKSMYNETPKQFMKSRMLTDKMNRDDESDF